MNQHLEEVRSKLNDVAIQNIDRLTDIEIVSLSQELDKLVVEAQVVISKKLLNEGSRQYG